MLLSLHGGHSSEFCNHASGDLEAMIEKYIDLGFTHVGISEHIPPYNDKLMYEDEKSAGLTSEIIFNRFELYTFKCEELKKKYKKQITIFRGFETETYSGYEKYIPALIKRFEPDYVVGSVHHINDICFDSSLYDYKNAVDSCKGLENFYNAYFDLQYEMLLEIKPQVAGHLDLVRIFDPDYENTMKEKSIREKISRNLRAIKDYGIIIDYNQRALLKNMKEPYPCKMIFDEAIDLGIKIVPGDDSHSNDDVGFNIDYAMDFLINQGVTLTDEIFLNFFKKSV
ncbi:MAG: histidinol-phosphatase [Desulforegulaceae bacterium]|nr:histidinol-phosphatase [Desulforegulaceae bacterium]